jgi:hypothetical protein
MEPECSLPYSQVPANCPYTEGSAFSLTANISEIIIDIQILGIKKKSGSWKLFKIPRLVRVPY